MKRIKLEIVIDSNDINEGREDAALVAILLGQDSTEGLNVHPGRAQDLRDEVERKARIAAIRAIGGRSDRTEFTVEVTPAVGGMRGLQVWHLIDHRGVIESQPLDVVSNELHRDQKLVKLARAAVIPDRPDPVLTRDQAQRVIDLDAQTLSPAQRRAALISVRAERGEQRHPATTPSARTAGLQPLRNGAVPLQDGESSAMMRLRGPSDAIEWFASLTAGQRGAIATLAHLRALELDN